MAFWLCFWRGYVRMSGMVLLFAPLLILLSPLMLLLHLLLGWMLPPRIQ